MRRAFVRTPAILFALALALPHAAAHTPLVFVDSSGGSEQVKYLFWQQTLDGQPIPFGISSAGTPDIDIPAGDPALDEFEAMDLAFQAWEQLPGVAVDFDLQPTATNTFGNDGENVIFFADLGDVGYGGVTLITYDNTTGRLLDVDVHMNDHNIRWLTSLNAVDGEPLECPCQGVDPGAVFTNDVQGLAAHEIGHVLGLDHSAVGIRESAATPTMYPRGIWNVPGDGTRPPNSRYRTVEPDDEVGMQALYPPVDWAATTATVAGIVHNRFDEPLFGAHVVARDLATGVEIGTMSGVVAGPYQEEAYALAGLPPGTYEIRAEPIDGSPPGLVSSSAFGGIVQALIPQKFPAEIELLTTYHELAGNAAGATPVPLAVGQTEPIDFRPFAFVSRFPRLLHPPRPFDFEVTLNPGVPGPLDEAKLVHTIGEGDPVETPLPLTGGTTIVPIPELAAGSLVSYHVEILESGGPRHRTPTDRFQVGLSDEPLLIVSKTGFGRISAVDLDTMFEVDETDFILSFPLGQAYHRGRFGTYVASFGIDKVSFVPFSRGVLPPTDPHPFDLDGDALLDVLEPAFGTGVADPDTDGDLALDGFELSRRNYADTNISVPHFEARGGTVADDGATPLGSPAVNIAIWNVTDGAWETGAMTLTPTGRWRLILPANKIYHVSYFNTQGGVFETSSVDFTGQADEVVSAGLTQVDLPAPSPIPEDTGTDPLDGFDGAIGVFQPSTDIAFAGGSDPYALALSPGDQRWLYVTGIGSDTVYKIDTLTDEIVDQAVVGTSPKGIAVTPDGTRLYVASVGDSAVYVVDAATLSTLSTIPLADAAQYVGISADGSTAVVTTSEGSADVVFIDVATDTVIDTAASGMGGLVFQGSQACNPLTVAGTFVVGTHELAVIDAASRDVSLVDLGAAIDTTSGTAVHPSRNLGYVIHYLNPELLEFDLDSGAIRRRLKFDFIDTRDIAVVIDEDDVMEPDGDGLINVCDNCPHVANAGQDDLDDDREGDLCDLDDGVIHVGLRGDGAVEWQEEAGFDLWNLYRGDVAVLKATGVYTQAEGTNPVAHRECALASPILDDGFTPAADTTAFYLIAGTTGGAEGDLGVDGTGATRSNDNPCP